MLNFKSFLKEELLNEELLLEAESSNVESDDKGKLHELLLAKYLHPNEQLPEHHRAFSENPDHAGTPEQVHEKLKAKIHPAAYSEIDKHARQSAEVFKNSMKEHGHIGDHAHIGNVHWTSNADKENTVGDHEKTVGVKDVNSNADLIVTLHDKNGKPVGHHGISAKYGSQEPNYRNPGIDSLEKTAKLAPGTLNAPMDVHHKHMESIGYEGSADQRNNRTKIDEMSLDEIRKKHAEGEAAIKAGKVFAGKKKNMHEHLAKFIQAHDSLPKKEQEAFLHQAKMRAETARASNLAARTKMAQHFASGLSKHSDEDLILFVKTYLLLLIFHIQLFIVKLKIVVKQNLSLNQCTV
jgi:hypothetical protein